MIKYKPLNAFPRGTIFRLLKESYAGLQIPEASIKNEYIKNWQETDNSAYDYPDTIGSCVLFSCINDKPIGFFSWDPRKLPEEGEIGHNCILPEYRGLGYGKMQIEKTIEIFSSRFAKKIKVTTDHHPFFIPAQKTYISCGFIETGRSQTKMFGGLTLIHYELNLYE